MKKTTCINDIQWFYNEPISSESFPASSVLPERFRSISEPTEVPIISKDLNSITQPEFNISEESEPFDLNNSKNQ